jgi:hypothetical protein
VPLTFVWKKTPDISSIPGLLVSLKNATTCSSEPDWPTFVQGASFSCHPYVVKYLKRGSADVASLQAGLSPRGTAGGALDPAGSAAAVLMALALQTTAAASSKRSGRRREQCRIFAMLFIVEK